LLTEEVGDLDRTVGDYVMKRLFANLTLAAIVSIFFLPLAASLRKPEVPVCCLPGGKHHCTQGSSETGFNSNAQVCPYISHFLAAGFTGLYLGKFELAGLAVVDLILAAPECTGHRIADATPLVKSLDGDFEKTFPLSHASITSNSSVLFLLVWHLTISD
jgi:hypothetical protein